MWQPAGTLAIESAQFSVDGRQARGNASAEWRDASLSLSTAQPVGSWRATLVAEGGPAKLMLTTVKGPLQLAGKGTLAPNGKLDFQGEARAEAGREKELDPLLDLIGPRRADGARTIEIR
jgi:general secretion pathway protein N